MSPPIRDGSGNSIGSIRLGDGTEISEVRTGAGDVLFSATTIPDSAILRYRFNEGSGSTAVDSIGSNDGTLNGDAAFSTNAQEGSHSLKLDGSGDFVDFSAVSKTNISATTSFNISSINTSFSNSNQIICGGNNQIYRLSVNPNANLEAVIRVSGTKHTVTSTTTINTGEFFSAGFGYDGSELRLYLNGSIEDTNSSMSGSLDSFSDGNSIGRKFADTNSSVQFNGLIDDTILYDQGLSKKGFDQVLG